jgi:hypothetical protein
MQLIRFLHVQINNTQINSVIESLNFVSFKFSSSSSAAADGPSFSLSLSRRDPEVQTTLYSGH